MSIPVIVGGAVLLFVLLWFILRALSDRSVETTKSVLSSDTYTKVLLTIIAVATSIVALQGFLS